MLDWSRTILRILTGIGLAVVALHSDPARAEGTPATVRIANIEWPPYNSPEMPEGGVTTGVVSKVLAQIGLKAEYEYMPFTRAAVILDLDPGFVAYLTEYDAPTTRAKCHLSQRVGQAPVILFTRVGARFDWQGPESLKSAKVGVVNAYVNDAGPIDAAIADGSMPVVKARDDHQLLRMIAGGRAQVGIMDANVFAYLTSVHRDLSGVLRMQEHVLKEHGLHVCFARNEAGRALRDRFDAALARIDLDEEYGRYFDRQRAARTN